LKKEKNMNRTFTIVGLRAKKSTSADLLSMMRRMFPGTDNPDCPYEHPLNAIGVVLLSAAIFGTTDVAKLSQFTGYSCPFISSIRAHMENNGLWADGRYDTSMWLRSDGTIDGDRLWEHVMFAEGDLYVAEGVHRISAEPCSIFWDERGGLSEWFKID
jgi:hypothetical protein